MKCVEIREPFKTSPFDLGCKIEINTLRCRGKLRLLRVSTFQKGFSMKQHLEITIA